ncbi:MULTISPECIES: SGNH/GDSL hydrolase family protein [unclassified Microbacterium]|uniref:SGNH/GDSL hydrolase family protein n=1 Tax=unclassified Microbacterium TaxID=2609290 RepID=UPI000EAAC836|nr:MULTISPECIES: SGNH/GDSL hydrolase family protein [unclassified Microbacterium]MBT2484632.1 SGNH/GDSL hydrolase family protein [Microbacterium sp. ISL-108]RKN67522.1 SGNH/GDSL hydrolase family protein [Microbacterium sp. CGR2]
MAADYVTITNLRGPAARITSFTANTVPADQPAAARMTGADQNRQIEVDVPRGLSGLNAVPTDEAVGTMVAATDTETGIAVRILADSAASRRADPLGGAAAERLFTKMRQVTADAVIVALGDSTGDAPYRWPRKLALLLVTLFPAWTVAYSRWNNTTRSYDAAEVLNVGTNGRTLFFWNASVSGGSTYTHQAPDAVPMYVSKNPDLVFLNDGHNEGSPAWTPQNTALGFQARYMAMAEDVRRNSPQAGIVCIGQNPPQNAVALMADKSIIIKGVAAMRGYGFADTTQAYIDAGTPASLYEPDLLHPNSAGGDLQAQVILRSIYTDTPSNPVTSPASVFTDPPAVNLIANGDFATLDATTFAPGSWSSSRLTFAKDTTNYENAKRGYGLLMTPTGGGQAFIFQTFLNATQIVPWRGRHVTLLARVRNNASAPNQNAGIVHLIDGVQGVSGGGIISLGDPWTFGGFVWRALTMRIADTATQLQVRVYGDYSTGAAAGGPGVTLDGVWLTEGAITRKAV